MYVTSKLFALFTAGAMASVATAAETVPLPNGQAIIEVTATAITQRTADKITVDLPVHASAATTAEARAKAQLKLEQLRSALVSSGISNTAILQLPPTSARLGFVGNEAYLDDTPNPTIAAAVSRLAAARQQRNAFATLRIALSEPRQIALVQPVLDRLDDTIEGIPKLALKDDTEARHEAIASAVNKARADAESYATATGFKIVRIIRISNGISPVNDPTGWTVLTDMMTGGGEPYKVSVQVRVSIEFLAEPK